MSDSKSKPLNYTRKVKVNHYKGNLKKSDVGRSGRKCECTYELY